MTLLFTILKIKLHKYTFTHRYAFLSGWPLRSPDPDWTLKHSSTGLIEHMIKLNIALDVFSYSQTYRLHIPIFSQVTLTLRFQANRSNL